MTTTHTTAFAGPDGSITRLPAFPTYAEAVAAAWEAYDTHGLHAWVRDANGNHVFDIDPAFGTWEASGDLFVPFSA